MGCSRKYDENATLWDGVMKEHHLINKDPPTSTQIYAARVMQLVFPLVAICFHEVKILLLHPYLQLGIL